MTKLILTKDVENVGFHGDSVEVKNGYAKNYLLPQNLAVLWSKNGEQEYAKVREVRYQQHLKDLEAAKKLKDTIDSTEFKIEMKITQKGKLYGAITNIKVCEIINEQLKSNLTSKQVLLTSSIKEAGNFEVKVKVYEDVEAIAKLEVVAIAE